MVVEQLDLVHLAVLEGSAGEGSDLAGLVDGGVCREVPVDLDRLHAAVGEVADALLAADDALGGNAVGLVLGHVTLGSAQNVAVETACQTAVGNDDHGKAVLLCIMLTQQRMIDAARLTSQAGEDLAHRLGVRRGLLDAHRSMADLGRGNHLHSMRDLLGALHRADTLLDIAEIGHSLSPTPQLRTWLRTQRSLP